MVLISALGQLLPDCMGVVIIRLEFQPSYPADYHRVTVVKDTDGYKSPPIFVLISQICASYFI